MTVSKLPVVCQLLVLTILPQADAAVAGKPALLNGSAAAEARVHRSAIEPAASRTAAEPANAGPMGPALGKAASQRTEFQPALPGEMVDWLKRQDGTEMKGRLQIGLGRVFDKPIVINRDTAMPKEWSVLPNGWRILSADVTSAQALGLRVHLESLALPAGVRLIVYDPANPGNHSAPVTGQALAGQREHWVETLFSERVIIECQVPPGVDPKDVHFTVSGVSHLYQLAAPATLAKAGACHNDVTCFPAYAQEAAGVARLSFVDGGNSYICTGCLVANNNPAQSAGFFLTANHCIPGQAQASTVELFWFYQTSTCNGSAPALSSVPRTGGGADLLAHSARNDFSFLQLRQAPPAGASPLRWSLSAPGGGETLACIQHPTGGFKRLSLGQAVGTDGNFWSVQWSSGVTEPGSSGGPLLDGSHQLIGQLYGGSSSCGNPSGVDIFGRFDVTYAAIAQWLGGSVPTPVLSLKGNYSGLFSGPMAPGSAGRLTLALAAKGRFTGSLWMGRRRYGFSGRFDDSGTAQVAANAAGSTPLAMQLTIDSADPDHLAGSVSDNAGFTAELSANRAIFNGKTSIPEQVGRYTMVIPGDANAADEPGGNGYGTVLVDKAGRVRFAAVLGDGTSVSQSATLSKDGQWPLFVPLYHGQGMLFSWLTFANTDTSDFSGKLSWFKPPMTVTKVYPDGFVYQAAVQGSSYVRPSRGDAILNLSDGSVSFQGGNLEQSFANSIALASGNRVVNQGPGKMSMTFSPSTGLFSGRVVDPDRSKWMAFRGAVLQKQNSGYGFFLGGGRSGRVSLGP